MSKLIYVFSSSSPIDLLPIRFTLVSATKIIHSLSSHVNKEEGLLLLFEDSQHPTRPRIKIYMEP